MEQPKDQCNLRNFAVAQETSKHPICPSLDLEPVRGKINFLEATWDRDSRFPRSPDVGCPLARVSVEGKQQPPVGFSNTQFPRRSTPNTAIRTPPRLPRRPFPLFDDRLILNPKSIQTQAKVPIDPFDVLAGMPCVPQDRKLTKNALRGTQRSCARALQLTLQKSPPINPQRGNPSSLVKPSETDSHIRDGETR